MDLVQDCRQYVSSRIKRVDTHSIYGLAVFKSNSFQSVIENGHDKGEGEGNDGVMFPSHTASSLSCFVPTLPCGRKDLSVYFPYSYFTSFDHSLPNLLYPFLCNQQNFPISRCLCTVMCLSIGIPKDNEFSICPKWKIYYF